MKFRQITAALLALLVLGAGAAAATTGAAPDKASADDQSGDAGPSVDVNVGPPGGLPDVVPDFVGDIHDTVGGFLNGSIESLGEAVSGVTLGGDEQPSPAESSDSGDDA